MQLRKWFLCFVLFILSQNANAANTSWQEASSQDSGAKLRIIDSYFTDVAGQKKLLLGLEFKLKEGWKIYGKESNGIGLPPSVDFKGSENYKHHEIFWPQAHAKEEKIGTQSFKYEVYEKEIVIPVEITLVDASKPTKINLKINYGLCKDICIPASSEFKINVSTNEDKTSLDLIHKFLDKKIVNRNEIE